MDSLPCRPAEIGASPERLSPPTQRFRLTLSFTGLKPGGDDARRAARALGQLPGVIHAYVNPTTEMAYIEYDPGLIGEPDIAEAIDSAGFRAMIAATDGV